MINIYLESKNRSTPEAVFIKTLLQFMSITSDRFTIVPINGKDNLHNSRNHFIQNTIEGGINLIIFDADSPENSGGYSRRKNELEDKFSKLGITGELFLFPDDSNDGDFESLLEKVARRDLHDSFFGCFNDYELCLGDKYVHPNRKGKLHAYITSMKMSSENRRNLGGGNWLFDNEEYWNLNDKVLDPLKSFLMSHFNSISDNTVENK